MSALAEAPAAPIAAPSDDEMRELFERARRVVDREHVIIGWLNEGQRGRSWTPRTRRGLRDSDLLDAHGAPLQGDDLVARLDTLEARYSPVVWGGAGAWRDALARVLRTNLGVDMCRQVGIAAASVEHIAAVLAAHADRRTGRSVTASNATVAAAADVPTIRVSRAKTVLRRLQLLTDRTTGRKHLTRLESLAAEQLHGGRQTAVAGESVLAMPPREILPAEGEDFDAPRSHRGGDGDDAGATPTPIVRQSNDDLSVGSYVGKESLDRTWSPSARARGGAPRTRPSHKPSRRPGAGSARSRSARSGGVERPSASLAMQRLAAGVVHPMTGIVGLRAAYGLDGRHVGEVVAALTAAGINPDRWSAEDVQAALDARFRVERRTWITAPTHPDRWFRWVLSLVDWSAPSPSEQARERAAAAAIPDAVVVDARARADRPASSPAIRAAARATLAAALRAGRQAREIGA